jgi:hypothetical protein
MKNHHHGSPHVSTTNVIHDSIATRAYELWEAAEKPDNQSDEFWLAAEAELVTGRRIRQADPILPVAF